jgi:hypothetical protein
VFHSANIQNIAIFLKLVAKSEKYVTKIDNLISKYLVLNEIKSTFVHALALFQVREMRRRVEPGL